MRTAVFTIASRNYFSYVETLMESLEETNGEWERFVAVADDVAGLEEKNFNIIGLESLNLPDADKMKFRYTILEFNTAIKPFVFQYLFQKCNYDRVLYFDPDIKVYEHLEELEACFNEGSSIVLTPHFTGLWHDDKRPDEVSILLSGTYNLGFLGLARSEETFELLDWWSDKLATKCFADVSKGIFVDQKWMDLVPGFFPNVSILRHEGYNVAYWNLSHRKAEKKNGKYYFNGQPLRFFHFSGVNPFDINGVSKYQNRFTIDKIGVAKELFEDYAKTVLNKNYTHYRDISYAFSTFSNGKRITDIYRHLYRENVWLERLCGENPFEKGDIFTCLDYSKEINAPQNVVVLEKRANKFVSYFNVLNKWIQLNNRGISIDTFFEERGYKEIAIYGLGELGNRLYEQLKDSKQVAIKYGIDKQKEKGIEGLRLYRPGEALLPVDAVVVTSIFDFENIKKTLALQIDCPIFSLEKVIGECGKH